MSTSHAIHVLGVIHARGGSKRIPLKNLKPLGGKPLVCWMVEAALSCPLLDHVIVSTDHQGIAEAATAAGASVPFLRPKDLAEDVPSEAVTQHAAAFIEKRQDFRLNIIVTLQPTTPFCLSEDIAACVKLVQSSNLDSAITVREVRDRPEWMFELKKENELSRVAAGRLAGEEGVWQSLPKLFIPNGAAYATRRDVLFEKHSIFGDHVGGVPMPLERSHDIDEPVDFFVAEALLSQQLAEK